MRSVTLPALFVAVLLASLPVGARADEPWLISADAELAIPLGSPQQDLFGPGAVIGGAVHRPLTPWLLAGARLRLGFLSDGDPPGESGLEDPGIGGISALFAAVRLRPLAFVDDDVRRGVGLFVELAGGGVLTGDELRVGLEASLGWGFELGPVDLAPVVRFSQIVQPDGGLQGSDARLLLAGVEVTFLDSRPGPPPPPPPPSDRDGDGYIDPVDGCPDEPEDFDDFEDEDGCPDVDNDQDGILDPDDACPNEPEDPDGFLDEDGCPDTDNDGDLILDGDDDCPNDPEIVNGNEDEDGCPDEGLIQMIDDRVVLDSQIMFATERAFIRVRARPVLDALINLWRQHPEWTRVRIEGHADYRGTDEYNMRLSEQRAQNVRTALVQRDMPEDMIEAVGYGSTQPRSRGSSESSLSLNRRVEFVVIARREVPVPLEEALNPDAVVPEGEEATPDAAPDATEEPQ